MSNPHSMSWIIWLLVLCWPAPLTMLVTALIVLAYERGWIHIGRPSSPKSPEL